MTVKIYKLIDPFTSEIRYVGKTHRSLVKRLWEHIDKAKYRMNDNNHRDNWIRQVLKKGGKPEAEIIKEVDESKWEEEEIGEIARHKKEGHPLTNIADGGMGGGVNKKRVAKLDYITLDVLVVYDSIHEAGEKEGLNYTRIIDSCSGRKLLINGFLWRYVGENGEVIHPLSVTANKHKIGKFDLHLNLIRIYADSISTNINVGNLHKACIGKFKTLEGHIWRHLDLYNNVIEPTIQYKHKTVSKMDMDGNVLEIYENAKQAAEAMENGSDDLIIRCCKGKNETHRGFRWKYNVY